MSLGFGSGHPLLIFPWDSLALLVPEAVAELLPRKLSAGGLKGEECHQAKARDRSIHMDRRGVSMFFLVRKVVLERTYFHFLVSWLT